LANTKEIGESIRVNFMIQKDDPAHVQGLVFNPVGDRHAEGCLLAMLLVGCDRDRISTQMQRWSRCSVGREIQP
jgi:hypothetical protein